MTTALALDGIAKGFLFFSHSTFIVPLLVMGFITQGQFILGKNVIRGTHAQKGPVIWGIAGFLILFSVIFNSLLKSVFQLPLNPALGKEGFAFPSGHMQASISVYGWIFYSYSYRLSRIILLLILSGIGFGLIHQGYHDVTDVLGAVVVGVATIYIVSKVTLLPFIQENSARLGLCLLLVSGVMMMILSYRTGIPYYVWRAFFLLAGFSFSWCVSNHALPETFSLKTFLFTCLILGAFALFPTGDVVLAVCRYFTNRCFVEMLSVMWFFIGAFPPVSLVIACQVTQRKRGQ